MKRLWLIICLVLLGLNLAACQGSSGPSTQLDVTMKEFTFTPSENTVPAGQEITLRLTNEGAVEHQFVIMKQGVDIGDDFTSEDEPNVYWKTTVEAGGSTNSSFTAPGEPGEYQVVCGTPGHYIAGMVGTLTVVAP